MSELSRAAQAVLDAYENSYTESGLVAALRAAADQVVPQALCVYNPESVSVRAQLLAIADELEAQ